MEIIIMMYVFVFLSVLILSISGYENPEQTLLIEAESFQIKGGWVVDPQFVEIMGSPYLLAHGLGWPVKDARTNFTIAQKGTYHIWVRTKNWAPGEWDSPGRFQLIIDNQRLPQILGTQDGWYWQYAGRKQMQKGKHFMALTDLTGFDGRCDAICLTTQELAPPSDPETLTRWREKVLQIPEAPDQTGMYDLVITGGGIAGCAAAIAAAEQGMNVALIHDRPVLGGNASGEIRVHTLGIYGHFERILRMLDTEHYPNGSPEAIREDEKRMSNIQRYSNIHLFLNWRAYHADTDGDFIQYVDARHTSTGERMRFEAPLFVDCTGDGWIGFWAGAEYMYGRESENTFGESWDKYGELWSPEKADHFVMGASLLWRSQKTDTLSLFPEVPWATEVAGDYAAANGEWQWEFSSNDLHQTGDAEEIRDHILKAIYGAFYNEKQKSGNENLALEWVSYLVGKRESRRLVGDHVYTFNDVKNHVKFPDSVVVEEREVDVHYQQNLLDPGMPDFISEALYYRAGRYYVPYRSLYSKNIRNMFMAGRCFSCSHIGLGGPRVMRTSGQMGAAVGYAASLCKKYDILPRDVYQKHLEEYMHLVLSSNDYIYNP
jgi:hypothetical protein